MELTMYKHGFHGGYLVGLSDVVGLNPADRDEYLRGYQNGVKAHNEE